MDTFCGVIVVSADKRIAEIPRVFSDDVIRYVKTERPQILDEEHRRGPGITFTESMNLPEPRNDKRKMSDDLIHRKTPI